VRRPSLVPLVLGTLALCGWLHARGVSALLGGTLAAPQFHVVSVAQAAPEPLRSRSADAILERNPFDSETGPLVPSPAAPAPSPDVDADIPPCDGVRVVSIAAFEDPEWSFAMLDVRGEHEPILRRRGGEVLAIARDRVLLDRGSTRCVARIFTPQGPPPVSDVPAGPARGIQRTGADSFIVDRAARDALIDGATDLMHAVSVRPEKKGDDVVGLRIAVLKPGTALDALGVRSGDVLLSMNGIPLTAPDRMLEAYARARTEPRLRLVIVREDRQLQLDYEVR
jgi:general secretion pathway protein C